jgi:hypothetical protein
MTHEPEQLGTAHRDLIRLVLDDDRPGRGVDRAVMAVVRDRQRARRWRTPVWLAAVAGLIVTLGLGTWLWPDGATGAPSGTILVQFEFTAPDAERVQLAGSFTAWQPTAEFTRHPSTGVWRVTVPLAPGEHEYLVVLDGARWVPDPAAHALVDDGFGQANSLIVVGPRGVVRS